MELNHETIDAQLASLIKVAAEAAVGLSS